MKYSNVKTKLLKNGYVLEDDHMSSVLDEDDEFLSASERWIDPRGGTAISFRVRRHRQRDGTLPPSFVYGFRVEGSMPDLVEFDEFNSNYTPNLAEAIRLSRAHLAAKG